MIAVVLEERALILERMSLSSLCTSSQQSQIIAGYYISTSFFAFLAKVYKGSSSLALTGAALWRRGSTLEYKMKMGLGAGGTQEWLERGLALSSKKY